MPAHKVKLEICGSSYIISTNDTDEYLLSLAEKLDADMRDVLAQAPNASIASAAVITALGYLDQADKNASGTDNMREQLQDYLEDAAKAKAESEKYRREILDLHRQLDASNKKIRTIRPSRFSDRTSGEVIDVVEEELPQDQLEIDGGAKE